MKDVISVDDLLMGIFNVYYSEYDGRYHNGRQADGVVPYEDVKPKLHSLLISKLPEKMVRSEVFEGESDGTIEAYNSAIDDMHRVIDEMFEVHNEK